jgi:uncharacterized protein (DUF488 family)
VDAVIDVRLRNTSQLAGFSKRDDLAFLLEECLGIGYEHLLELAPTDEMLDAIKSGGNWSSYEQEFRELLTDRNAVKLGRELLARYQRPCLLCAEPSADQCHRRLIAEWWSEQLGDVEIVHL